MGQGVLGLSDVRLSRIAESVGTPCYVYSVDHIREQWDTLTRALDALDYRVHYSVKANSNSHVLRLLRTLGAGADIVSGGELARVTEAGIPASDIVFSGVGKTSEELCDAIRARVGLINIESDAEFDALQDLAGNAPSPVQLGIRVNPDVTAATHPYTQTGEGGMKFGVPLDRVPALALRIGDDTRFTLRSVGMHLGSQIADPKPYRSGGDRLVRVVDDIRSSGTTTLESVSVGGGMAIAQGDVPALDARAFVESVQHVQEATGLTLLLEPGRFLVGGAGVLLTSVLYTKHSGGKDFVVVDAGMNDLVRPSYYEAIHDINVVRPADGRGTDTATVDVVGPICESGDFLGQNRLLPGAGRGALLSVGGVGAYGFTMASTYNSRPRPAEVVVDGDSFAVARRREPLQSLWTDEVRDLEWTTLQPSDLADSVPRDPLADPA